jgi:hypothetical protein
MVVKRKLSLKLKAVSTLIVSVLLVSTMPGIAHAKKYMELTCLGSEICSGQDLGWAYVWAIDGESPFAVNICSQSIVSVKVQVKSGKRWKNVKGSADSVSRLAIDECPEATPYSTVEGNTFHVKSKGTKKYRYVITGNSAKPTYINFKIKASKEKATSIGTDDYYSGAPSGSPQKLDLYLLDKLARAKSATKNLSNGAAVNKHYSEGNVFCAIDGTYWPENAGWIIDQYKTGSMSQDEANSYADAMIQYASRCPL